MALTKYPTFAGAGTYVLTVTAPVSIHTKGTYVEIVAATPEAARGLYIVIVSGGQASRQFLLDIATGAAAAETVLIANIPYAAHNSANTGGIAIFVPVAIAAGVRLSARCQCGNTIEPLGITVTLVGGTSSAVPTTYGADTAASKGTVVNAGASANTKGAYAQLTASSSAALDWLIVIVTNNGNTAPQSVSFSLDIATGAAAAETVVVPDMTFTTNITTTWYGPPAWAFPVSIAAGTRIAARIASGTTDANDRVVTVAVIGITESGLASGGGGAVLGGGLGDRGIGVF